MTKRDFLCTILFSRKRRFSISLSHLKWHFPKLCFFAEFSDMSVLVHLGGNFRLWTLWSLDGIEGQKLPSSLFKASQKSVPKKSIPKKLFHIEDWRVKDSHQTCSTSYIHILCPFSFFFLFFIFFFDREKVRHRLDRVEQTNIVSVPSHNCHFHRLL